MERLTEVIKRRIVEHLACFRSHAETAKLVGDEFGLSMTPRHVRAYDPNTFQFAGSLHWIEYHQLARERFAKEIASIAISHRAFRLNQLNTLYYQAVDEGNVGQAAKMLEQAAKEVGFFYERVRPRR